MNKQPASQNQGQSHKPRLQEVYEKSVISEMAEKFGYKSRLACPRLHKIVVNMGLGEAREDAKIIEKAMKDLSLITGQMPRVTKARKAISNFKIRQGLNIGCSVTLRKKIMYEFLDRFISIACPRIRDFRGFSSRSFDGSGNYTLGINEHIIFAEIDIDKVEKTLGMDITIVTTAESDEEARQLLQCMGFPFRR